MSLETHRTQPKLRVGRSSNLLRNWCRNLKYFKTKYSIRPKIEEIQHSRDEHFYWWWIADRFCKKKKQQEPWKRREEVKNIRKHWQIHQSNWFPFTALHSIRVENVFMVSELACEYFIPCFSLPSCLPLCSSRRNNSDDGEINVLWSWRELRRAFDNWLCLNTLRGSEWLSYYQAYYHVTFYLCLQRFRSCSPP